MKREDCEKELKNSIVLMRRYLGDVQSRLGVLESMMWCLSKMNSEESTKLESEKLNG